MPALPIIGAVAAVVGAGAAVVGTINSNKNQNRMIQEQRKAAAFERRKQDLSSMRQKIDAVRQGRIAAANAQQTAENQGVAGSSAAQGGQGSIISQMNANLSFLDAYGFLSDQAGKALDTAAGFQSKANMWGAVANIGAQVFSAAGGFGGIEAGFKGPPPPVAK